MKIKGRQISDDNYPLIIAEIGINHQGDVNIAKHMIKEAFKAGNL